MTPRLATALAARLFPYRTAFLWFALASFVLLTAAVFLVRSAGAADVVFALYGPFVFVPWFLLCVCSSFGPGRKLAARSDRVAANAWRWYASVTLLLFFVLAVAWPFFVLLA